MKKRANTQRLFLAAAPVLLQELKDLGCDAAISAALTCTCSHMRKLAADQARPRPPPPPLPHLTYTHEGGAGGRSKENQDTSFVAQPSPDVSIYAVFDGHGKSQGRLAAKTAAATSRAFLCAHHRWVLDSPEEALRCAFEHAHTCVRHAILRANPEMREHQGRRTKYLLAWMESEDEEGEPCWKWDAVDGGTTATLVVVLRGSLIVAAVVGDSSALLLGLDSAASPGGSSSAGYVTDNLVEEHSPTNLSEYVRVSAIAGSERVKFVYDCPDLEEFPIFGMRSGEAYLDLESRRLADEHDVMFKNSRDDRFTLVVIPEEQIELPPLPPGACRAAHMRASRECACKAQKTLVEEQMITMTRSLGDFFAHEYGVTYEPEINVLQLPSLKQRGLRSPYLLLASDGVWDLWNFDEVCEALVPAAPSATTKPSEQADMETRAANFFEATRAKGADYFGESADNLTGVLVDLRACMLLAAS